MRTGVALEEDPPQGLCFTWVTSVTAQLQIVTFWIWGWGCFPGGSDSKETPYKEGELGSIPESGRSAGEENGNPLQYS